MQRHNQEKYHGADFIAVEKNLASLGYFTPSNKRVRTQTSKTVTLTKIVDGKRLQAKATIIPGATFGLPTTADQDKYIALQKIVMDSRKRYGEVRNPIGFSSAELLDLLGQCRNSGRNYEHIDEWLNVMTATTIISEGTIYLAGSQIWSKDRFRVFERAASIGNDIGEGKRADRNYVWFSEWQLENINKNHLLPIDFESYLKLQNHISKALVLHLQVWLYASRDAGRFEKRYDELCQILNLRPYLHASKIKEKLGPSLDELVKHGYLANWNVDTTSDHISHKIIFQHGRKFGCDQKRIISSKPDLQTQCPAKKEQKLNPDLICELVKRGIPEKRANRLLLDLAEGQQVKDQLEWGDHWIQQNSGPKIVNPTGFYTYLIHENIPIPETFETSRRKILNEEAQKARDRQLENQATLELAYEDYRDRILDSYIAENYPSQRYQALIERKKQELSPQCRQFASWKPEALLRFLNGAVRADLERDLSLQTFESFCQDTRSAEEHRT